VSDELSTKGGPDGANGRIQNKAQELGGRGKEAVGDGTGNQELQCEGQDDQTESGLKQSVEKIKDAAGKVKDVFTKNYGRLRTSTTCVVEPSPASARDSGSSTLTEGSAVSCWR